MKKNIILTLGLVAMVGFSSCEDFLESTNTTNAEQETFFDSDDAVEAAILPLYNYVWNSFNEKAYYSMGDGRANNLTACWSDYIYPYTNFTETSLSPGLQDSWASFYSVIAQANYTINNIIDYGSDAISESAKIQAFAEARFMRGIAYWYIASLWELGIIYENTTELATNPIVPAYRQTDVLEFAVRDMEYAAANLSENAPGTGRVTRYAAYGMLSRFYLTMAGLVSGDGPYLSNGETVSSNVKDNRNNGTRNTYYLDLAKKAAKKCIEEGPYSLLDNFGDLFQVSTWNNNAESIFQLQWYADETSDIIWGCNNAISAFFSWSTMVGETNWGNATYASWDLVNEFQGYYCDGDARLYDAELWGEGNDNASDRCNATIAHVKARYYDLNTVSEEGYYEYNVTETGYSEKCNIKKHVIGLYKDNGRSFTQSSGVNTYIMRLPEVLLNYVDADMGASAQSTSSNESLEYFNQVHMRAGNPRHTGAITWDLLRHERRLEFVCEGLYWYDLLRWSYFDQNVVVNYLNTQSRNYSYEYDESLGRYKRKDTDPGDVSTATPSSLVLPLSDVDKTRNSYLSDSPSTYEFGEREVNPEDLFK